jgi:hypothetical protein
LKNCLKKIQCVAVRYDSRCNGNAIKQAKADEYVRSQLSLEVPIILL